MPCNVTENSVRARPTSIKVVQPKALGSRTPKSSTRTPLAVHAHSRAVAVIANMASGTGLPGLSRFHAAMLTIINTTQISEPPMSRNTPL
jgi:hypothetical protein